MIRHLITAAVLFTSAITCFSQTEEDFAINKGTWMIGGSGNFRIDSFNGKLANFSISPTVGYFVGKKLAVGLGQSIDGIHSEKWTGSYTLQPFVRYYFLQKKFAPFLEAACVGGWVRNEYWNSFTGEFNTVNGKFAEARVAVGLNYFIAKKIALEGTLQYYPTETYSPIDFRVGLQFFIRK